MLGGRFVYRRKRGPAGEVVKHKCRTKECTPLPASNVRFIFDNKARWVVRGFEQQYGINYRKTFAVVRSTTYRFLLILAVLGDWQVTQHDFVTAFFNPPLDTEFYMELLPRIGKSSQVAKLLKIIYGLK